MFPVVKEDVQSLEQPEVMLALAAAEERGGPDGSDEPSEAVVQFGWLVERSNGSKVVAALVTVELAVVAAGRGQKSSLVEYHH